MARPVKSGLDYFPLDVDFFENDKTELISAEFGIKGEIIMIRLMTMIYKNGYYYEWNEEKSLLLAKRVGNGCTGALVDEVVTRLAMRSFFSERVLSSFGVLTSKSIQENYLAAVSRRIKVEMIQEYCLISCTNFDNVDIYSIHVDNNGINEGKSTQSKENESKLKKSIDYIVAFNHYLSFENLIKHKNLSEVMKKSMDKAVHQLGLNQDELLQIIERHSKVVSLTSNTDYPVKPRPLYELFGQKAYQSNHLICAEYLDDGSKYLSHLVKGSSVQSKTVTSDKAIKANKRNSHMIGKDKQYSDEELEAMLLNRSRD